MNLYIQYRVNRQWVHLINADGKIVGTLQQDVAAWLIKQGVAMDVTNRGDQ